MLSGSWPGELSLFRGLGDGKFAAGEPIKGKDGKALKPGSASTAFAADWDGDGDLDLLAGNIDGHALLYRNEGPAGKLYFAAPQKLEADGKAVHAAGGDSHPVLADWDKDGRPDLVVGCGSGGVVWYRNAGSRTAPKLEAAKTLVAERRRMDEEGRDSPKAGEPGTRAKVCVADWDGDGWPDLLVGDFSYIQGPEPKMSDADRAALKQAQEKLAAIYKEYEPLVRKYSERRQAEAEKGAEPDAAADKAFAEEMRPFQERMAEHQKVVQRFSAPGTFHGRVWLFQRRPPPNAGAAARN